MREATKNIAITGVGYPLLGAVVLLGALGIPLPLTVALADFLGEALWAAVALAQGYLLGGIGGWGLTLAVVAGALIALATMLVVRWSQRRVGTREIGSRDLDR